MMRLFWAKIAIVNFDYPSSNCRAQISILVLTKFISGTANFSFCSPLNQKVNLSGK